MNEFIISVDKAIANEAFYDNGATPSYAISFTTFFVSFYISAASVVSLE